MNENTTKSDLKTKSMIIAIKIMKPKLMVPADPFLLTGKKVCELMACQATNAAEEWKISLKDLLCPQQNSLPQKLYVYLNMIESILKEGRLIPVKRCLDLLKKFSRGHTVIVNNVCF